MSKIDDIGKIPCGKHERTDCSECHVPMIFAAKEKRAKAWGKLCAAVVIVVVTIIFGEDMLEWLRKLLDL